ncbi:hypothetical protein [Thermoflavimicrobium dichotomicum]|uniref:SH3 domain-containing protein n=1 Tax=Thermoflavimicrobium dichotomicum TaxID=46223 RepID=A0A1I3LJ58_9BACL|nr:hypothetical protein [Thermoflavimicrobium dichotomicum]SFI84747.1 hypothetical protein SAMN05421852_102216 [Thermoflavimicrobium dichotomicum]
MKKIRFALYILFILILGTACSNGKTNTSPSINESKNEIEIVVDQKKNAQTDPKDKQENHNESSGEQEAKEDKTDEDKKKTEKNEEKTSSNPSSSQRKYLDIMEDKSSILLKSGQKVVSTRIIRVIENGKAGIYAKNKGNGAVEWKLEGRNNGYVSSGILSSLGAKVNERRSVPPGEYRLYLTCISSTTCTADGILSGWK